jgi:hypothetical protein
MSFQIVRKAGYKRQAGTDMYVVAVIIKGALLRRVFEEPWNTPPGALAIPDGFELLEHTHVYNTPPLLPGHVTDIAGPWILTAADTLDVSVGGGASQIATLGPGDAADFNNVTPLELAAVLERDLVDVRVEVHPAPARLYVMAANFQTLQILGGALQAKLGLPSTLAVGSLDAGEQAIYHSDIYDSLSYLVDILDPNQTQIDLAPTLRSWDAVLFP